MQFVPSSSYIELHSNNWQIITQAECTSLNQELQDMEVRARRGQKKIPDEANQVIQVCILGYHALHCRSYLQ